MRSHDMVGVTLRKRGHQFLSLEVPGLAERRPSLVQGDYVLAKLSEYADDTVPPYQVVLLKRNLIIKTKHLMHLLNAMIVSCWYYILIHLSICKCLALPI